MSKFFHVLWFLLFLCAGNKLRAQGNAVFSHYTIDEGLSQGTINSMCFDKSGFLWIATNDGLNRFDGYNFVKYYHTGDDTNSLPSSAVKGILGSGNGLWLTMENEIAYFNMHTGRVMHRKKMPGIFRIVFDDESKNLLYYYVVQKGLFSYDYRNKITNTISGKGDLKREEERDPALYVNPDVFVFDSIAWILEKKGLVRFDIGTGNCLPEISGLKDQHVMTLSAGKGKDIWAVTSGNILMRISESKVVSNIALPDELKHSRLYNIKVDAFENVWIPTYGEGLIRFNTRTGDFFKYVNQKENPSSLTYNFLISLAEDDYGNLWIGTNSRGIDKLNLHTLSFSYLGNVGYSKLPPLTSNFVRSIYLSSDSILYVGTNDQGLDEIDLKTGKLKNYKFNGIFKGINNEHCALSICETPDKTIWIATYGRGIYTVKKGKIQELKSATTFYSVNCIVPNGNDGVLFAASSHLYKLNIQGERYRLTTLDSGLEFAMITPWKDGFYISAKKDLFFVTISGDKSERKKVSSFSSDILSMLIANDGRIIAGTSSGLRIYDNKTRKIESVTQKDGLPNNTIYGVLQGAGNKVWLSTNNGLCSYDLLSHAILKYGPADGIQGKEFNSGAYFRSSDGVLWFGGMDGVTFFKDKFLPRPSPGTGITGLDVGDKKVIDEVQLSGLREFSLNYNQNTISIRFAALNFGDAQGNSYQYRLEGEDREWVDAGSLNLARYTNLRPGNYIFLVRSKQGTDEWGPAKSLAISIMPPFWMSWWFRIIVVLISGSIVYFSIRYISQRRLRMQLRRVEMQGRVKDERARIARELHDNFGSRLTYIIMNLENLDGTVQKESPSMHPRVAGLSEYARGTMQELRETVWTMNMEHLTLQDLNDRIGSFLHRHFSHNENLNWEMDWHVDENHSIQPLQSLNILRVVQEASNNCIKYASATSFTVWVKQENERLLFDIKDNGKGFDQTAAFTGFGISNMNHRTEEIKGSFSIVSGPGSGTHIHIEIPL